MGYPLRVRAVAVALLFPLVGLALILAATSAVADDPPPGFDGADMDCWAGPDAGTAEWWGAKGSLWWDECVAPGRAERHTGTLPTTGAALPATAAFALVLLALGTILLRRHKGT